MKINPSSRPARALVLTLTAVSCGVLTGCADTTDSEAIDIADTAAAPTVAFPSTPQWRRVAGYFAAYGSGDVDQYTDWLLNNRDERALSAASLADRQQMFATDLEMRGELELQQLYEHGNGQLVVIAQPGNGGPPLRHTFHVAAEPPYKIGAIDIAPQIQMPQRWADLDAFTDQLRAATGIPALAIGVLRDGSIVAQAATGRRRVDARAKVALDDTFHWGSITKSVTGTMLGVLIAEGVLDWDTTVADALGDMPMRKEYRDATIAQVMSHQAGFVPYEDFTREFVERYAARPGETLTDRRRRMVADILQQAPLARPGVVGRYSNAGITVAGYIAERLTGQSWRDLVRAKVFEPAGMSSAGFDWPAAGGRPDQPYGHFGTGADDYEAQPPEVMLELIALLDPAGNVRSSVGDMLRYADLHLRGMRAERGPIDAAVISRLHTSWPDAVPVAGEPYTFGWAHGCTPVPATVRCHAHNGGAGTFYAELRLFPDLNMAIAYMGNAAAPTEAIAGDVFGALFERFGTQTLTLN